MAKTQVTGKQIADGASGVDLTVDVTGVLPVPNGGSGAATLTGLLVGNGTSPVTTVTAPTGAVVGTTDAQVQTNKTLSDTFMGEVFDAQRTQRDTTLLASNDFLGRDLIEITASASLEIPSTSTMEIISYYTPGSTDVAITDGGTGASTASAARVNLGVSGATGVNVKDSPYNAVGNGIADDTAAFNAASIAAGVGGRVYVPAGTYIVNGAVLSLAYQRWEFAPGAHMKLPNGATDGKIVTVTGDYCILDGGEWDGNRTNVTTPVFDAPIIITGTHCTVRNARVHDCDGWGILAFPATTTSTIDGTVVENCILTDCVSGGVMFDCITYNAATVSSSNLRISGCYASIPSATPVAFWGGFNITGSTTNRVIGAVIENCYVYKPVGVYTGCGGIFWRYISGMQCANNYVYGTDLAYTFDDSEDSCLTGCTAFGWGLFGIEIGGTLTRTAINGCTLDGNGVSNAGIGCDNATNDEVTITGCTIGNMSKTSGGKGISVQTGGRGWTITGNNIRTPSIGIEIYNVSLTNLTLANNTFEMDSGGSQGFYCGIYLDPVTTGARGWVVKDNNLIGWTNYGIRIEHGSALTASNITVQQNVYTNTGATLSLNNVTLDGTCQAETFSGTFIGEVFDTQKTQRDTMLLASNDFTVMDVIDVAATTALEIPSTSTLEVLSYQPRSRSGSTTVPGTTFTLNTDLYVDGTYVFLNMGAALALTLIGTPRVGQKLMLGFKDDGTARAITYSANCVSSGVATLLATTVSGKLHWMGLMWDGSRWAALAVDTTGY